MVSSDVGSLRLISNTFDVLNQRYINFFLFDHFSSLLPFLALISFNEGEKKNIIFQNSLFPSNVLHLIASSRQASTPWYRNSIADYCAVPGDSWISPLHICNNGVTSPWHTNKTQSTFSLIQHPSRPCCIQNRAAKRFAPQPQLPFPAMISNYQAY